MCLQIFFRKSCFLKEEATQSSYLNIDLMTHWYDYVVSLKIKHCSMIYRILSEKKHIGFGRPQTTLMTSRNDFYQWI